MNKLRFEEIVEDNLDLSGILKDGKAVIKDIIDHGMDDELWVINGCILKISSLALFLSGSDNYADTQRKLSSTFAGQNPTTVITMAILYYILKKIVNLPLLTLEADFGKGAKDRVERICRIFDKASWMVGEDMKKLGIEPLPKEKK